MLIVSNISEGIAVIEDGGISFDIPAGALPDNTKEGDVILWENGEYLIDEKATADSLKDGWLYTGDMAMQDEEGFIYLVDRKKDVIITGGENLYPVQIENFMAGYEKQTWVDDETVATRTLP